MMTSVSVRIVCYFVEMGISIINRAVVWGNLFSSWWREGFRFVLDLIKIIKRKPHC